MSAVDWERDCSERRAIVYIYNVLIGIFDFRSRETWPVHVLCSAKILILYLLCLISRNWKTVAQVE